MQSAPAIPPRPARAQDKDNAPNVPAIPPRPTRRFNRSVSPNPDRFAPSPLNESLFPPKGTGATRPSQTHLGEELERSVSVEMPNIGEEGREYAAALDEKDPLRHFRDEFIIPSKKDLKRTTLAADASAGKHHAN